MLGAGNFIPIGEAASVKWALDESKSMLISVTKGLVDSVLNNKTDNVPLKNDVKDEYPSDSCFDDNMADKMSAEGLIFVTA